MTANYAPAGSGPITKPSRYPAEATIEKFGAAMKAQAAN